MQGLTEPPRDGLTAAQVMQIVRDSPSLLVNAGLELIDQSLAIVEDISDVLRPAGGAVSRNTLATLHGTARLSITTDLDWGQAIVRPYLTLSDGVLSAQFYLGAYYTSTPGPVAGTTPRVYAVEGYDILHGLNTPVGEAYAVDAGVSYLTAIGEILATLGYTALIDQTAVGSVLPAARVWPIDEETRWLSVVNDLLAEVGYVGIWSDWLGRLRSQPYTTPTDRSSEWTYDLDPNLSILHPERSFVLDLFHSPNRWVAIRSNNIDGPAPVEGNGLFTFVNQSLGPASVDARGGRVINRILRLEAADQAALVARAQQSIDADIRTNVLVKATTSPNPLHWHFDRLHIDDPELGSPAEAMSMQWTLPLDGGLMTHEWRVL